MNDSTEPRGTSNIGSTLIAFALGAVVGGGLALLLAPESGKKTRQRLTSRAQRWSEDAARRFDQARDAAAELGADTKSAMRAGKESFLQDRAARDPLSERRLAGADEGGPGRLPGKRTEEEAVR